MNDEKTLTQIKECIGEARKKADPKRDELFLFILERLDKEISRRLEKLKTPLGGS